MLTFRLGTYALIGIWSIVEVATGLFCASVIAIKPLMRVLLPSFLSSSHSYSAGSASWKTGSVSWKEKRLKQGSDDIEFQAHRVPDRDTFSQIQPTVSSQAWGYGQGEGYGGRTRRAGSEAEILKETAVTTETRPDSSYRPESDGSGEDDLSPRFGHV